MPTHMRRAVAVPLGPWALLCLALVAPLCVARGPAFPAGSTPHFRHLSTDDGLANSDVHGVAQDPVGYMWIATDNGLQRYDGYRFVTYQHDPRQPGSLAQNIVTALAFGPDGSLWLGTEEAGLERLPAGSEAFVHHRHDPKQATSLANDRVSALLFDREGRLWIGTDAGLDRLDTEGGAFHHYPTHSSQPNGERILSLYQDPEGRLWVGADHGVYTFDAQHGALAPFVPKGGAALAKALPVLTGMPINVFYSDAAGRLWIGSEHGLAVLDHGGAVESFYTAQADRECGLSSDHIRGLLQDESGDMWIVTLNGGLVRFDHLSGCFNAYQHDATDPGSLQDDALSQLYRDRTGLMWISSYYGGIAIYNPRTRAFGYYQARPGRADGLAGNNVTAIYKGRDGVLWVGGLKGLTRLDAARRHYTQFLMPGRPASTLDDIQVNAVYGDREGRLWVGSDYGLSLYHPESQRFDFRRLVDAHGDPYQSSVSLVFEDAEGRLWIGTEDGLLRYDAATGRVLQRFAPDPARADSLPNGQVNALCQTHDGALWVGTLRGLARFDGVHDHFQLYGEGPDEHRQLSSATVMSCYAGSEGYLWIGTDNGLDELDPASGGLQRFGVADGLPDPDVLAIQQDSHGDLWLATDHGLVRYAPGKGVLYTYGEADGVQKGEFNPGAAFTAADGEAFFGGVNGLNSFYPASLPPQPGAPDVAITRFTVLGRSHSLEASVLRYRENILSFEFAAFDYAQPARNRFRYLLEGFDEDWHTSAGARSATYTNLDPGQYVLHVRGSDDGITWSRQEATVALTVLPPPWRTWWAYLGYVLLLLLGGGLVFYFFARSIRRRQAFLDERNRRRWAEALHQLIQSVTALEEENAIAACLLDSLFSFIEYDRALFYVERDSGLALISVRGGDAVDQLYHERWPSAHPEVLRELRTNGTPRLLTPEECRSLEPPGQSPRHYLAVPLLSGNSAFRLLLVGRASKTIEVQGLDIAAAMAKQVSVALDKARLIKDLESLATTDGLTRLFNRRTFLHRAENEFERSRRYQRPLSVLMLDVDHFKTVNDTRGHETGDRVLRILADTCRKALRQQDVTGRYGGEEFVAYLPETGTEVAREVAERLRRSVEALAVNSNQGPVKITLSIGVATLTPAMPDISALINAADQALYEAKQKGRNRVVLA